MIVKLRTEHPLEFLSLKEGCRGSSESTLVKMSNCWKSHAAVFFLNKWNNHLSQCTRFRYLSHRREVKVLAGLSLRADSSEPSLLAYTKYVCLLRPNFRPQTSLNISAWALVRAIRTCAINFAL